MNPRLGFRVASTLAVIAFIIAMFLAWLAAPVQMALVTASRMLIYWLGQPRKDL